MLLKKKTSRRADGHPGIRKSELLPQQTNCAAKGEREEFLRRSENGLVQIEGGNGVKSPLPGGGVRGDWLKHVANMGARKRRNEIDSQHVEGKSKNKR